MGTRLQKKLAKAIVNELPNEKPKTGGELLESAGYSPITAIASPGRTLAQKGVLEELNNLGFSEEGAKKVVANILYSAKSKDHDKLDAADKVFKVHGSYAPDKHINLNVEAKPNPEVEALAEKLNELLKQ